jgi:imidazolonepropionase-like amidohydrolase
MIRGLPDGRRRSDHSPAIEMPPRPISITPLLLASLAACAPRSPAPPPAADTAATLAVAHATLIDGTGAPPRRDMTVVVRGDTVIAVGPTGAVAVPDESRVIDATGKFLMPGLWDMHAHIGDAGELALRLYAAAGVTGVRDAGGDLDSLLAWRARIARHELLGPRLLFAGPQLDSAAWPDSSPAHRRWRMVVRDSAEGAAAVATLDAAGVDYIKVHHLGADAYAGVAAAARRGGIPFAGHLPDLVTTDQAVGAGQRSLEHSWGWMLDASSRRDELRAALRLAAARAPDEEAAGGMSTWRADSLARLSIDPARAAALFRFLAAHEVWVTPTLATERAFWLATEDSVRNDPRLRYLPLALRSGVEGADTSHPPQAELLERRRALRRQLDLIGEMHGHGVRLLAGTDLGYAYVVPGFSLHDELSLLVQAGLAPMAALQAATRNVGEYLGDEAVGTIAVGSRADLVLLDADPLADIGNVRRVSAVVLQGRLLDRRALEGVLRDAEAAAGTRRGALGTTPDLR